MRIKQSQLQDLKAKRSHIDDLSRILKQANAELSLLTKEIFDRVDDKSKIERGVFVVAISESSRRSPKWKDHFAAVAGPREVERILQETEPTITRKLVLFEGGQEI